MRYIKEVDDLVSICFICDIRCVNRYSHIQSNITLSVLVIFALIQVFRFIPDWRFDDLMVSFATLGGVGPHIDNYDVFLLQGEGSRRWKVGAKGDYTPSSVTLEHQQEILSLLNELLQQPERYQTVLGQLLSQNR